MSVNIEKKFRSCSFFTFNNLFQSRVLIKFQASGGLEINENFKNVRIFSKLFLLLGRSREKLTESLGKLQRLNTLPPEIYSLIKYNRKVPPSKLSLNSHRQKIRVAFLSNLSQLLSDLLFLERRMSTRKRDFRTNLKTILCTSL